MHFSTFVASLALASPAFAAYKIKWNFSGSTFFDNFQFINEPDTSFTQGFAQYVDQDEATARGLVKIRNNKAYIGPDMNNTYSTSSTGRKSVRLHSWGYFDQGLLVADFAHVPVAGCGQWPAFWVYRGETAQGYSEIDIFEEVNKVTANTNSFYTSEQCTVNYNVGTPSKTQNCNGKVCNCQGTAVGKGCSNQGPDGSFNQGFNQNFQVIALQVEANRIKIWHFKKNEVPADLSTASPNPDNWKTPTVHMSPNQCDFFKAFSQFHIIINLTFCGGWAGGDYDWNLQCAQQTGQTCKNWVANNPNDFKDTYFEFNSIKLFQLE